MGLVVSQIPAGSYFGKSTYQMRPDTRNHIERAYHVDIVSRTRLISEKARDTIPAIPNLCIASC
jgi:hypothetical protein